MTQSVPKVVVVGAGFAGLQAVKELSGLGVAVTLIERNNYHLFQPLLYQVATAGLAPEDIVYPLRAVLRDRKNVNFRMAEVLDIDKNARKVITNCGDIPYNYLLLAVGAETNFFGMKSVQRNGVGLKNIVDALRIRNHILHMFELASQESDLERRRRLLTFVIAGGGATGVESAGGLSELIHLVLAKDYPAIDFSEVKLILLEGGTRLLSSMSETLSDFTAKELKRKKVEVRFQSLVAEYDGNKVILEDGTEIGTQTLIWAAGVQAASLAGKLSVETDRLGRIVVNQFLQVPDYPEIFIVGDAACFKFAGQSLPMIAPVAVQQAKTAAHNILRLIRGQSLGEFKYEDPGTLATIGRSSAVASMGRWQFRGFIAWVLWLVVHLIRLIGFRNRLLVTINWAWDYFFYERAVRLILRY